VPDGISDGNVLQLHSGTCLPKQQTSAAHVAATYERRRKQQPPTKNLQQHIYILGRGNGSKQHGLAFRSNGPRQPACAGDERLAIDRIRQIDVDLCEELQRFGIHVRVGGPQPGAWSDHQHPAAELAARGMIGKTREA
jgi:hypothetical protein